MIDTIDIKYQNERLTLENPAWPKRTMLTLELVQHSSLPRMSVCAGQITFTMDNGTATYQVVGWKDYALELELLEGVVDSDPAVTNARLG